MEKYLKTMDWMTFFRAVFSFFLIKIFKRAFTRNKFFLVYPKILSTISYTIKLKIQFKNINEIGHS